MRQRRSGPQLGRPETEPLFLSAISAPFHRDNESSLVFLNPLLSALSDRVENVCSFKRCDFLQATRGRQAGGFSTVSLGLPFHQPRGPFLDLPDLDLPVCFLVWPFQGLKLGRRVLRECDEERLLRQARRPHLVEPRGPFFRSARSWFAGRLSCLSFSRARTASPSSLGE